MSKQNEICVCQYQCYSILQLHDVLRHLASLGANMSWHTPFAIWSFNCAGVVLPTRVCSSGSIFCNRVCGHAQAS